MPRRRNRVDEITGFRASYHSDVETEDDLEPTLNRFADDTSMLGFRYLHSRYKTWFRLLWALLLAFFLGLTVYQVVERITYYFIFNPLATRRSFDAPTEVPFPGLLICNKMQLKASKVSKQSQSLLKAMCYIHDEEGSFNSTQGLNEFDHIDLREVYRNSLQSVDDLVLSCEYEKGRSCVEDVKPILTPQGLCFTVSPNMTVRRPGPETTLSLLLNLETYEIIPGTVSEPGVLISLYDRSTPPSAHFTAGIHLDAGKAVSIPINDMRKLTRHANHCGRRAVGPFREDEYSRAACKWVKAYEAIERSCGCVSILSPSNGELLARTALKVSLPPELPTSTEHPPLPPCTFEQETLCVENITSHLLFASPDHEECPEDCDDVSYSSVVFGGQLSASEVASIVRTDWEDDKEKRLSQFMPAFEIIPNARIPLVRAVQALAWEAQTFLDQALEALNVQSATSAPAPCINSNDGIRVLDRAMRSLHDSERMWKHIANYVELVLTPHLKTVLHVLRLNITSEFLVESVVVDKDREDEGKITLSSLDQALFDLRLIEDGLMSPLNTYGLRNLETDDREQIIKRALTIVESTKNCLARAKDEQQEKWEPILQECSDEFSPAFTMLQSARVVANNPESALTSTYEEFASKLTTRLQSLKWMKTPKVFQWNDFNLSVKEFEQLYKEGGRDNEEIVELLKMRKIIHGDLIEAIIALSTRIRHVLEAREEFMIDLNVTITESANASAVSLKEIAMCLDELPVKLMGLKKSSFLRAEWMSRVARQVAIAQSYSPGTQYDEVNLLLVKVYFAHFKQETIVQEKSYNVFLLLAEIGGTIGLYVGATLLTIAETIVFFFETRTRHFLLKPDCV